MKLERILKNILHEDLKIILSRFMNSKDKRCKAILLAMYNGYSLFESLKPYVDNLSKELLNVEHINILKEIGNYMEQKQTFTKQLYKSLMYPMSLMGFLFIIIFTMQTLGLFKIYVYMPYVSMGLVGLYIVYIYYNYQNRFKKLMRILIVLLFLENKIYFSQFNKIFKFFHIKINYKPTNLNVWILETAGCYAHDITTLKQQHNYETECLHDFMETNNNYVKYFSIILTTICIVEFMYKAMMFIFNSGFSQFG